MGWRPDGTPPPCALFSLRLDGYRDTVCSNVMAGDTDGDGTDDSVDDCPVASGNSTFNRTGCPDRDGDGTSDLNDPWVMSNGGYQQDQYDSSSDDYSMVRFSDDATQYATFEETGGWWWQHLPADLGHCITTKSQNNPEWWWF